MYHFQISSATLSEYPDLSSRILKSCALSIRLPNVNQAPPTNFVGFEIDVLHLKYESVQVSNTNTARPFCAVAHPRARFYFVKTIRLQQSMQSSYPNSSINSESRNSQPHLSHTIFSVITDFGLVLSVIWLPEQKGKIRFMNLRFKRSARKNRQSALFIVVWFQLGFLACFFQNTSCTILQERKRCLSRSPP